MNTDPAGTAAAAVAGHDVSEAAHLNVPVGNTDVVIVAPYDVVDESAANLNLREVFVFGHKYRIRQNCSITAVRIRTSLTVGVTDVYVRFWRLAGATYTLVGETENLFSDLGVGSSTTLVQLSTPIPVREGDYYSILQLGGASPGMLLTGKIVTGSDLKYIADGAAAGSTYDWEAATTLAGYAIPVELYAPAPVVAFIGDSIMSGCPGHFSFLHATGATNLIGNPPYFAAGVLGVEFQNLAIGSQATTQIASRFAADVVSVKPRIAVIGAGANDLVTGLSSDEAISSWRLMLNLCRANSIRPVIVKQTPWNAGTVAGTTSADGAVDGTTVVCDALVDQPNWHKNWWVTIGGVSRQATAYDGTSTLTVSPAFSAQVTSGTAVVVSAMPERDARWERLAALAISYPGSILIDLDYAVGKTNASGPAGNLWDTKTEYNSDNVHFNPAGYEQIGRTIGAGVKSALRF